MLEWFLIGVFKVVGTPPRLPTHPVCPFTHPPHPSPLHHLDYHDYHLPPPPLPNPPCHKPMSQRKARCTWYVARCCSIVLSVECCRPLPTWAPDVMLWSCSNCTPYARSVIRSIPQVNWYGLVGYEMRGRRSPCARSTILQPDGAGEERAHANGHTRAHTHSHKPVGSNDPVHGIDARLNCSN